MNTQTKIGRLVQLLGVAAFIGGLGSKNYLLGFILAFIMIFIGSCIQIRGEDKN